MANRRADAPSIRLLAGALASAEAVVRAQNQLGPAGYSSSQFYSRYGSGAFQYPPSQDEHIQSSTFMGILPLIRKAFLYLIASICLMMSSLALYGVFYKCAMPGLHASESLYFDYTGVARHPAPPNVLHTTVPSVVVGDVLKDTVEGSMDECIENASSFATAARNNTDEDKDEAPTVATPLTLPLSSFPAAAASTSEESEKLDKIIQGAPWAVADLFAQQSRWEAHHPDILPPPKTKTHILTRGTAHYMEVLLDLPESEINRRMGMFGVFVELQSTNGTRLASSIRTARIPHESFWISVVRKVICIIPHMIGALPESRRVLVPSFRYYIESEKFPLVRVIVILGRASFPRRGGNCTANVRDNINSSSHNPNFSIYECTCAIVSNL
jgi:hypothetical protein